MNSLIKKYHHIPTPAKAAFWFTACQVIQNGCSFLAMPFLVRLLTPEQFGIKSVYSSWVSIIGLFATLSLHAGVYNNAMFKYPDDRSGYTSSSQSLSAVCTVICFVVYIIFRSFFNNLFGMEPLYIIMMFVQLLFTESFLLWSGRQRYEYRYVSLLIYTAVLAVLYMIVPIVSAMIFPQEQRLTAVIVSGVIIQAAFGLAFMVYNYCKGRKFFQKDYWSFALKFNIPLIPHYLSGIVLGHCPEGRR